MREKKKFKILFLIITALAGLFLASQPVFADNFTTWNSMSSGTTKNLNSIWGTAPDNIFAAGSSGTILHYDGTIWASMSSGTTSNLYGLWGAGSDDIFVVGEAGVVLHYDGSAWTSMNSGTTSDLYGIWGFSRSDVFAVGEAGAILHYNGSDWTKVSSDISGDLNGIWATDDGKAFAVGDAGVVLYYNGSTWSSINSGIDSELNSVWGFSADNVFAVGKSGSVIHFNGSGWTSLDSGTTSDLNGVWGADDSNIFIAGKSGTIAHYDGSGFSPMNRNTLNELRAIWGFSPTDVFAAGWSGAILRYLPPVITSISPGQGDQGKAMRITITGANLSEASEVRLGKGVAVNSFSVVEQNQLTADITIVASAETGARDVTVVTPGGSSTLPGGFTIKQALPVITSASPDQGRQGESLNVTLTGMNLSGATEMRLGTGIAVNSFSVLSDNQVTASIVISKDAPTGARNISVTVPGGSFTLSKGFTVNPGLPTISSISPDQGNQETTTDIVITGEYFSGATKIQMGTGIEVNSFDILSPNQISASITIAKGAATGARDVTVTAPGGSVTLPDSFMVKQALPAVTSVEPDNGSQGATLTITISGINLSGASEVKLGPGIAVNSFNVINAEKIEAQITILSGADIKARDVTVVTPGGSSTLPGGFIVNQSLPVITSVSPDRGSQGETLTVVIGGSNLGRATSVSFGSGAEVQSFNELSPTQLRVNLIIDENAVPGMRDVTVTTPGGISTAANSFNIKEKSTATLFVALLWVVIAIVIVLFGFLIHMIRKRRSAVI